jgi:hypothetical protein
VHGQRAAARTAAAAERSLTDVAAAAAGDDAAAATRYGRRRPTTTDEPPGRSCRCGAAPALFRHAPGSCQGARVTEEPDWGALDTDTPNAARMYDYHLGGSHNFAADRAAAEATKAVAPWVSDAIRANRAFLGRAVRFCVDQGIDQFLDLGSGIPTVGNVHEIATAGDPEARVAYVDNETVAVLCSRSVLGADPRTTITQADLCDPDAVLAAPGVRDLLDFSRPVALLTVAVLHFVPDSADPSSIVARYRSRLAPGSFHLLSHATGDHAPDLIEAGEGTYRNTSNPLILRTRDQVAALLGDLELVEPGLVDATEWRPDDSVVTGQHVGNWAAVGRVG